METHFGIKGEKKTKTLLEPTSPSKTPAGGRAGQLGQG